MILKQPVLEKYQIVKNTKKSNNLFIYFLASDLPSKFDANVINQTLISHVSNSWSMNKQANLRESKVFGKQKPTITPLDGWVKKFKDFFLSLFVFFFFLSRQNTSWWWLAVKLESTKSAIYLPARVKKENRPTDHKWRIKNVLRSVWLFYLTRRQILPGARTKRERRRGEE